MAKLSDLIQKIHEKKDKPDLLREVVFWHEGMREQENQGHERLLPGGKRFLDLCFTSWMELRALAQPLFHMRVIDVVENETTGHKEKASCAAHHLPSPADLFLRDDWHAQIGLDKGAVEIEI